MKHQIAQFLFDFLHIFFEDSIGELVGFFNGEIPQAFEGLLPIPGALLT